MSIRGSIGGKLTGDQIASNSAPAIASSQSPYVLYSTAPFLHQDFREIQQQVANKYLSQTNVVQPREDKVIWGQFPIIAGGTYYYQIIHRLPDGTITSSIKLSMYNPIL